MVRFRPLRTLAAVTALIAVPLLPLAASAQAPKYGGVLVTAPLSAAPSLSPHEESTVAVVQQASPCFNNLVYYDPAKKQEMIQKSGGRMTFPQIFIDGKHIGGSDDLHALDARGGLDPLLEA